MERESPLNGTRETLSCTKGNLEQNPLKSSLEITKHTKPLKENFTSKLNHPALDNRNEQDFRRGILPGVDLLGNNQPSLQKERDIDSDFSVRG